MLLQERSYYAGKVGGGVGGAIGGATSHGLIGAGIGALVDGEDGAIKGAQIGAGLGGVLGAAHGTAVGHHLGDKISHHVYHAKKLESAGKKNTDEFKYHDAKVNEGLDLAAVYHKNNNTSFEKQASWVNNVYNRAIVDAERDHKKGL